MPATMKRLLYVVEVIMVQDVQQTLTVRLNQGFLLFHRHVSCERQVRHVPGFDKLDTLLLVLLRNI